MTAHHRPAINQPMQLEDKIALVTGAGRGMGQAIAVAFAREGAHLALADLNESIAEETSIAVRELGRRSLITRADVGNVADIDRMVAETVDTFGRIDILVNNVGVGKHYLHVNYPGEPEHKGLSMMDTTEEEWDIIFKVNAKATFFCTQRVASQMIKQGQGGRIINIGSAGWKFHRYPSNADGAYGSAKAAVITMTRTAALQLGRHNINVNVIVPGLTRTPSYEYLMEDLSQQMGVPVDELIRRNSDMVPTGRISEPEDIAAMAVFLAGQGARNITGQELNVNGGLVMH